MTPPVGVGLAGLGRMGRLHARNLATRCSSARLVSVYDADPEVCRGVAEELGVPPVADFDEMLRDDAVAAVALATPTRTHVELAVRAARAGKDVFCEKPLALDRESAVSAVEVFEATGRKLQVGFHRRFDPDWRAAHARIHAGELGEVFLFRTSLRDMVAPHPEFLRGAGGFFVDVTIHDLDTARWLVGEVVSVTAHGAALSDPAFAELGDIDTAVVVLRFANGALGVIDNSRAAGYGYECSTEVVGSHATVRVDQPLRRHYEWRTPGIASYELVRDFEERYPEAYLAELDSFGRCVRDDLPPEVSARDALAAFDLARAAEHSWRSGRTVALEARSARGAGVEYVTRPLSGDPLSGD